MTSEHALQLNKQEVAKSYIGSKIFSSSFRHLFFQEPTFKIGCGERALSSSSKHKKDLAQF